MLRVTNIRKQEMVMKKKYFIVVVGTTFSNKTVHGVFEDMDEVNQWTALNVGNQPYEIVPIDFCSNPA